MALWVRLALALGAVVGLLVEDGDGDPTPPTAPRLPVFMTAAPRTPAAMIAAAASPNRAAGDALDSMVKILRGPDRGRTCWVVGSAAWIARRTRPGNGVVPSYASR